MKRHTYITLLFAALFSMTAAGCAGTLSRTKQGQLKVQVCTPEMGMSQRKPYLHCQTKDASKRPNPRTKPPKAKNAHGTFATIDLALGL
jgi:hypothetical protein